MFEAATTDTTDRVALHDHLEGQWRGLIGDEADAIANMANTAALIFATMPDLNWAGFYLMRGGELVLGPFQGRPACVRIAVGRGVCGTAVAHRATMVVDDVHAFPGHIACDTASRSELVVPLLLGGEVLGVLDLDSPIPARFDADDQHGIERIAAMLVAARSLVGAVVPSLSLRINLDAGGRIGPGKIALLENIAALGSIAAAGRAMGMSYRRAWQLVDETNILFGSPVVQRQTGGRHGGGACLTPFGLSLVTRFRAMESAAAEAARSHLAALQVEVRQEGPASSGQEPG